MRGSKAQDVVKNTMCTLDKCFVLMTETLNSAEMDQVYTVKTRVLTLNF